MPAPGSYAAKSELDSRAVRMSPGVSVEGSSKLPSMAIQTFPDSWHLEHNPGKLYSKYE